MSTFTVTEVSDKVREYPTEYGPKKAYRVHLRNGDGTDHLNIEWRRNADSPPPAVGQQLEGDLVDQGQYGQRLQMAPRAGGGGFGSRPEDPQRQKRIVRQHSQEMAVRTLTLANHLEILDRMSTSELFELIKKTTDWFERDVESAAS